MTAGGAAARAATMSNAALLERIETVSMGTVTKFTPTPVPRVSVRRARLLATVGDIPTPEARKVIPDVPVAWPSFGTFALWADLAVGDTVMLLHPKGDIGDFKAAPIDHLPSEMFFSPKSILAFPVKLSKTTAPPFLAGNGYVNLGDRTGVSVLQINSAEMLLTSPLVKLGGTDAVKGVNRVGDAVLAGTVNGPPPAVPGGLVAWAALVEGACNAAAPGTFGPTTTFAVMTGNPGGFATTGPGSARVTAVD